MPTAETLKEMQQQFNEERGEFIIPVLWVDDDGVNANKLTAFSQTAQAQVTVVHDISRALEEWCQGKYAGLIVDHGLAEGFIGADVIKAIIATDIIPSYIAVVSAGVPRMDRSEYPRFITDTDIFHKDQPYDLIGQQFRHNIEETLAADGQHPKQLNALDRIS